MKPLCNACGMNSESWSLSRPGMQNSPLGATCATEFNESDPHPFISLLTPTKGKKILPRLTRHLSSQRMLTLLTLLVACFSQLDVVHQAPCLDYIKDTQERSDVERQTQAFLGSVMQSILPVVS